VGTVNLRKNPEYIHYFALINIKMINKDLFKITDAVAIIKFKEY